jgi:hypothetical protein
LVQALYAFITAALLSAGGAAWWYKIIDLKELLIATLPIVSTFLGATLAFRLSENKENEKEALRRKQALDFSLFILLQQDNAVRQIAKPYTEAQHDAQRAFLIPAFKPPDYSGLRHDLSSLSFLLEVGAPQVLFELAIEQERFSQLIEALRVRNEFYVSELQPALEKTGMIGRPVSLEEAEQLLGKRIFGTAMNQGRFLKEHLDASVSSIPAMFTKLRATAKTQYPSAKFLAYDE